MNDALVSNASGTPVVPVILSGGIGSRLWPLSRKNHPKPFIRLEDGQSLVQKTYLRALSIPNILEVVTVTHRDLFFYTKDEYKAAQESTVPLSFILEPFGRNSTAAIAVAAHYVEQKYGSETLLVILPADHLIRNNAHFLLDMEHAFAQAKQGALVTLGIPPTSPKTGYGYIEVQNNQVLRFIEKPDLEKAKTFLGMGNFFWNSGLFCFSVHTLLEEMKLYCPHIADHTQRCIRNALISIGDNWTQSEIMPQDFLEVDNISIDYAILEKSKRVVMVPSDMDWSDIGSWIEFGAFYPPDSAGNHIYGTTILEDVHQCILYSENRLIAGIHLRDLIIADTPDALLIADRHHAQNVRHIVEKLQEKDHEAYKLFPTVHRPWGSYTVLQESECFKIKRIEVKPGAKLSVQMHHHRSEHWVVVGGKAKVLRGHEEIILDINQSTYISMGQKHCLENVDDQPLVIIEIQCGDYLGEDDIVRFSDAYGRATEVMP